MTHRAPHGKTILITLTAAGLIALLAACGREDGNAGTAGTHTHADGTVHTDDHDHADDHADGHMHDDHDHDHDHDEVELGVFTIGDMQVRLAQSHGAVEPGKEGHLVVKLPYTDGGATIVRAWLGGEDRTLSYVGRGEYAAAHDDYDVHATAPDPLPENTMWWIEIEKPDGSKVVGSAPPLMD